jgi:hypothetical protein
MWRESCSGESCDFSQRVQQFLGRRTVHINLAKIVLPGCAVMPQQTQKLICAPAMILRDSRHPTPERFVYAYKGPMLIEASYQGFTA